jgi:hypothetical protein
MSCVGLKLESSVISTGGAEGGADKTILQLVAAANHAIKLTELSISFRGTNNAQAPILVKLVRQTTAGAMTTKAPVKDPDDSAETLQASGQENASVEPTTGDVLMSEYVHPQTGYTWQAPPFREVKIGGGSRLGIVVNDGGTAVNCVARMYGEE